MMKFQYAMEKSANTRAQHMPKNREADNVHIQI